MSANILVVEDEPAIQELIAVNLQHAGHHVIRTRDAEGALGIVRNALPDLLLIDWMLPGMSGVSLAKQLRQEERTRQIPIIMLTARGELRDKVAGFEAGADDYVTKPFSFQELSARVRAVLKRTGRGGGELRAGGLCVDPEQRRAWWRDRPLNLCGREFDLLATLTRRPGRVFSREELLHRVWGAEFEGESNVVDVTVGRLREKLDDTAHALIATVRGIGYTLRIS